MFVSSKIYIFFRTCIKVFIGCRLMKTVHFRTVPIWLLHTVWLDPYPLKDQGITSLLDMEINHPGAKNKLVLESSQIYHWGWIALSSDRCPDLDVSKNTYSKKITVNLKLLLNNFFRSKIKTFTLVNVRGLGAGCPNLWHTTVHCGESTQEGGVFFNPLTHKTFFSFKIFECQSQFFLPRYITIFVY